MDSKTKDFRKNIADAFIKCLSEKEYDWKKGWNAGNVGAPRNAVTGRLYKGINKFMLLMKQYDGQVTDPRYATFNQIKDKGWHLKAGSKGTQIEYWVPYDVERKKYLTWEELKNTPTSQQEHITVFPKYHYIFNAKDIEGIEPLPEPEVHDIKEDEIINIISKNMNVEIINDGGDRAFYRPSEDRIHLPLKEFFKTDYDYNSVALHELSHATGAAGRLNRNLTGMFASDSYAYEELVAEISSAFMSNALSSTCSDYQMANHKAYIQSWITELQKNPNALIEAIKDAERAADYLEYNAEIISLEEFKSRNEDRAILTAPDPLAATKKEIVAAGFSANNRLLRAMTEFNNSEGRKVSLKEIAENFKSEKWLNGKNKNLIDEIVSECQRQEKLLQRSLAR